IGQLFGLSRIKGTEENPEPEDPSRVRFSAEDQRLFLERLDNWIGSKPAQPYLQLALELEALVKPSLTPPQVNDLHCESATLGAEFRGEIADIASEFGQRHDFYIRQYDDIKNAAGDNLQQMQKSQRF